jgi:hypothetical protein
MSKYSKHQEKGKHSLDYDIIFKGKKEDLSEGEDTSSQALDNFQYDSSSRFYEEYYNNEDYIRRKDLTEKIFKIIKEKTDINLQKNRRKPSREDFNRYFSIIKKETKNENFSNIEIFNELALYFSNNLFSIFKLLDNEWRNLIIKELQNHIGKVPKESKEVNKKNLTEGSEVEFYYYDQLNDEKLIITGVIKEFIESENIYRIDSFEKVYDVYIEDINKILNNTKFKYNLNKLNNVDFL